MTVLSEVGRLESTLRESRDAGRKLLVPYVTGGLPGWERAVEACAAAGADAIEVGIPFSDPVIDGRRSRRRRSAPSPRAPRPRASSAPWRGWRRAASPWCR